ncbi:hypothetical protein SAMN05421847_0296 [Halpernia humi]|uniref:BioF2-like acetyltransferase domain-containing protein n=1 Tax=Halpernia humi TaxID=493375 RepID=A0A1H5SXB3_9FLAO|nr:hypothetical protein [Halpernia humi]SEF55190.1 hypothetical protein SAMN05421847_0296 [Halpernia humi]
MIKVLKYSDIDFVKYTGTLRNSAQYKYSAEKDFLDITSDKNWDLLVFGNYEAVMPLPFIKKMGLKFIANPKLCQQIGIFSEEDIVARNDAILDYFIAKFNIAYYAFNDTNSFTKPLLERRNYLIFPNDYEKVKQKYSPKRKRKLRIDEEVMRRARFSDYVEFAEAKNFISKYFVGAAKVKDEKAFIDIFERLALTKNLAFYGFYLDDELINLIAIYIGSQSVALLGTFNNREFIKISGSSYIIDKAIEANIQSKIFDFEGSEVPSIEEFFRGFRPELRSYKVIRNSKIDIVKNLILR